MASNFLNLNNKYSKYAAASALVVPINADKIIVSSQNLNTYDAEIHKDIKEIGIHTLKNIPKKNIGPTIKKQLKNNKWLLTLSNTDLTPIILNEYKNFKKEHFALIYLGSHLHLGSKGIITKCSEFTQEIITFGTRSFSQEEVGIANKKDIIFITDKALYLYDYNLRSILHEFPHKIYLTIDLDFFSPDEFSSVPNPIPGGPLWWPGLMLIRNIFRQKEIVGTSISGFSANPDRKTAFATANLALKCIGYHFYLEKKIHITRENYTDFFRN